MLYCQAILRLIFFLLSEEQQEAVIMTQLVGSKLIRGLECDKKNAYRFRHEEFSISFLKKERV